MRRSTKALIGVGLAVVLLAGGAGVWALMRDRGGDPASVVREYLDAIAAGDATKANEMVDFAHETESGEALTAADGILLNDKALATATERIKVKQVETIKQSEDRALVQATVTLAGETFSYELELAGEPGGRFEDTSWRVAKPYINIVVVKVEPNIDGLDVPPTAKIAGQTVPVENRFPGKPWFAVAMLYPGVYPASVDGGEYFVAAEGEVLAKPLTKEGADRLQNLPIDLLVGNGGKPDLVLPLATSDGFDEALVADAVRVGQACAGAADRLVRTEKGLVICPKQTAVSVIDYCDAHPDAERNPRSEGNYLCEEYRGLTPLRGALRVEAINTEVLRDANGSVFDLTVGSYRFTDENGATHEAALRDVWVQWFEGKPMIVDGSFDEAY